MIPERIGNYRLIKELGKGGMGVVYEAVNDLIDLRVAIKVLYPQYSQDRALAQRFLNEARAANLIRHPGIVAVPDVGQLPDGATFIAMEYLEGESMRARLERGPMSQQGALRVARQIASALAAAHNKGIIHRDLKPENVMLVPDPDMPGGERVKVLDFGIAKLAEELQRRDVTQFATRVGALMGTPHYMAPEQCRGAEQADPHSDVYALGIVLYEMLSGLRPFDAPTRDALLIQHIMEAPPPLGDRVPGLPARVAALVQRMLAKDPGERPSMQDVCKEIDGIDGSGSTGPKPWPWIAGAALAGVIAIGALGLLLVPKPPPGPHGGPDLAARPADLAPRPADLATRLADLARPPDLARPTDLAKPLLNPGRPRGLRKSGQGHEEGVHLLDIEFSCGRLKGVEIVCGGASCSTDASGRCRIAGVTVGQLCRASHAGYLAQELSVTGRSTRISIELQPDQVVPPG